MGNIGKILIYTKKFWRWYAFLSLFIITTSLLSLVVPILVKQIVDIIVAKISGKNVDINYIFLYLFLIVTTDVSITSLTAFGSWIGDILSVRLHTHLTKHFYQHLLKLDIGYYDNEITGKLVNKMYRGIESISDFVNDAVNNFLPFFLTAIVTIVFLAYYSPVIALLLAILFPTYIVISHKSTLAWNKIENEKNTIQDLSQGRVFESISGIRVVKAFVAEAIELLAFLSSRKTIETLTVKQTRQWHLYDFYRRFALNIIIFSIMTYIVISTFQDRYTIGEMTLLLQLVEQARFPLFAMSFILSQIQHANAGSKDFFEILAKDITVINIPEAKPLLVPDKKLINFIEFRNIKFSYEQNKNVLYKISFSIKQGEKLALVGESGQGKSTLINLLLRFYIPQKGAIYIAGQDISKVTLESLHQKIAVVFQESLLFSGTISENISYGNPKANISDIVAAAKAANAHNFIMSLPEKYQAVIGERGAKLSGGEKQRLAIARAILKNSPIIIMDEATSSLDSRSEIQVQIGLDHLIKNRTAIIIAHRLSTIADADHILVLSHGTVVQYGTPSELEKDIKGPYAHMVKLQNNLMTASREEKEEALRKYDLVV